MYYRSFRRNDLSLHHHLTIKIKKKMENVLKAYQGKLYFKFSDLDDEFYNLADFVSGANMINKPNRERGFFVANEGVFEDFIKHVEGVYISASKVNERVFFPSKVKPIFGSDTIVVSGDTLGLVVGWEVEENRNFVGEWCSCCGSSSTLTNIRISTLMQLGVFGDGCYFERRHKDVVDLVNRNSMSILWGIVSDLKKSHPEFEWSVWNNNNRIGCIYKSPKGQTFVSKGDDLTETLIWCRQFLESFNEDNYTPPIEL